MEVKKVHRGYFSSAFGCRCPRCREGNLFKYPVTFRFKRNMEMNKNCLVCGQASEIEVGFYYGTSYVSYLLTVGISVLTLIAWYFLIGLSTSDNRFFFWLAANAVFLLLLQAWLMRVSRSLWISWFVKYDPDWEQNQPEDVSERMNSDQANNW